MVVFGWAYRCLGDLYTCYTVRGFGYSEGSVSTVTCMVVTLTLRGRTRCAPCAVVARSAGRCGLIGALLRCG